MSRIDRINEEIRYHVTSILQKDAHDPRIGFVTITKVDTSADLRLARVYFTVMEGARSAEDTLKALKNSKGFMRTLLSKRLRIKFAPQIIFINDASNTEINRIDEIIDIIHREKEIRNGVGENSKGYKR